MIRVFVCEESSIRDHHMRNSSARSPGIMSHPAYRPSRTLALTSLYRKWRSTSFDDVIGQAHVTRTLRNAVRDRRVSHAYLFTGPRGTGKTSTARILSRAVNCLNPRDGNPCNECEACSAAQEGRALDVIEIDAASNTSVENVRDLRERVGYAASEGGYKVYIVDEVHRLSAAAFDAFLKTLEEPPPHVIFVFASTEPQKVPATIASRCQRFDFKRISPSDTRDRLRMVAGEEGMSVTEDALDLMALNAGGSLRDALGLLDQVSAFSGTEIRGEDVRQALGLADPELIVHLVDDLLAGEIGSGLSACTTFVQDGGDPKELINELVKYWRSILLWVSGARDSAGEIDPTLADALPHHAEAVDRSKALAVIEALTGQYLSPKYNVAASLPLEMGYVQASLALQAPAAGARVPEDASPQAQPSPRPVLESRPDPMMKEGRPDISPESRLRQEVTSDSNGQSTTESLSVPNGPSPVPFVPTGDLQAAWRQIVSSMGGPSKSIQALLRSGYPLKLEGGTLTIGFLHEFHRTQTSDVKKRRLVEEVVRDVLGTPHQVICVLTTREELASLDGAAAVDEDDGFIEEAADRLRDFHIKQITEGHP